MRTAMEPPRSVINSVKFYREVVIHPNVPHTAFSNWNQFMMEFREGSTVEVEMERMKAVAGISTDVCAFLGEALLPPELDSGVLKHSSAVISIYPKSHFYSVGTGSVAAGDASGEEVRTSQAETRQWLDMIGRNHENSELPNNANNEEAHPMMKDHAVTEMQADITTESMDCTAEVSSRPHDELAEHEQDPDIIAAETTAENMKNVAATQEEDKECLEMTSSVVGSLEPQNNATEAAGTTEARIPGEMQGDETSKPMDCAAQVSADEAAGLEQGSYSIIVDRTPAPLGETAPEADEIIAPSNDITANKVHDSSDVADSSDLDITAETMNSVEERVLQPSDVGNVSIDDHGAAPVAPKTEEKPAEHFKTEFIVRRGRRRSLPSKGDANQQKHDELRRSEPVMMPPRRATLRRPSSVAHEEDKKSPKLRRSTTGFEGERSPNENSKPIPSRTRGRGRGTNKRRSSATREESMKRDQMAEEQENTDMAVSSAGINELTFSIPNESQLRRSSAETSVFDDSNANTTANLSPDITLGSFFSPKPTDL